ncbi:MAG TPA: ATP-binding protein [Terriglobales bacterium]
MNSSVLNLWSALSQFAISHRTAEESAALILLAASLLVFRTFRERYLLLWILGWAAYFSSSWTLHGGHTYFPEKYLLGISHAEFVLAVCMFSAAICLYTHAKDLLVPLLCIAISVMGFAFVQSLLWPDSITLRVALEVAYRIVLIATAGQLLQSRWTRKDFSVVLLSASLLCLHLNWAPVNAYFPLGITVAADLLLGISMLFVVFDDSRMQMRRLAVINSLTTSIARAQQHGPMMEAALEELKGLMGADAAWFRLIENGRMAITQQIGLSTEFVRDRNYVPTNGIFKDVLRQEEPVVLKIREAAETLRDFYRTENFHHIVVVPIIGKKSLIGTLTLGCRHRVSYAAEELKFLKNTGHQLGLASENFRLVEQILRSHRQWSNTFDSIHDSVLLHDSEFKIMKANRALLQRLGKAAADVAEHTCEEVLPQDSTWKSCPYCSNSNDFFFEGVDPCFGGFATVSTSSYSEQGSNAKGTIHVVRDVTDHRVAEEKYRQLFEQVQEGVFVANADGKMLDCNDAFVRMLGHNNREDLMALNIENEIYASQEQRDALRRAMELHNYVRNFEVTLLRKDGSLITAMESSFATRNAEGKIERYQGFLLDISEKKHAEDEIRRRNRELNALNAMAVIATQSFDLDEILNLTLRQVVSMLSGETGSIYLAAADGTTFRRRAGWGLRSADRAKFAEVKFPEGFGDLVTRARAEVITPEYLPHLPTLFADFIRADGLSTWIWVLLWSKDGPIGIMGISNREARDYNSNDENLLVAIGRQLATTIEKVRLYEETCRAYDDLRLAQEQLLQSEKMSAIGQLIAGVAHELNNPLTAILGYAQLLESEGLSERAADFVAKLFKQAQRTHRVVQNLLSFARQRKPQKQEVDICKVIDETLVLRDYDLKVNDVQVVREIAPLVAPVTADSHQLEQVFLNIINNAVDAMLEAGKGGVLTIRVSTRDGIVHIEFQDSGPGIKEPNRIFDPFYTTKSVGKGTGLGLSICYGIIKEHNGDITARNREDGGAILEITLPAADHAPLAPQVPVITRRELVIQGRILLVEAEPAVLEFERDVLAGSGAQVVTSMKSDEAKELISASSFDAIIMDGKMPSGWNAPEVYRWLQKEKPGMEKHILFTFSSLNEPELRSFLNDNSVDYLVKPFEVADLISNARRLLHKTQAASAGSK